MSWSVSTQGTKAEIVSKLDAERASGQMPDDHHAAVSAALDAVPESVKVITISAYGHRGDEPHVSPLSNLSIMISGAGSVG